MTGHAVTNEQRQIFIDACCHAVEVMTSGKMRFSCNALYRGYASSQGLITDDGRILYFSDDQSYDYDILIDMYRTFAIQRWPNEMELILTHFSQYNTYTTNELFNSLFDHTWDDPIDARNARVTTLTEFADLLRHINETN